MKNYFYELEGINNKKSNTFCDKYEKYADAKKSFYDAIQNCGYDYIILHKINEKAEKVTAKKVYHKKENRIISYHK